jgi:signal peptidase I
MENEPEMSELTVPSNLSANSADVASGLEDAGGPGPEHASETTGGTAEPPPENKASEAKPAKAAEGESWLETVKTIFYALLIAVVIRTFFFQPFNIPSGSMESTLLVGDYLFVEKFAYGYSRNSFPFRGWPVGQFFHGRLFGSDPARGDVVVFKMPNPNSADYNEDFIKRVIGLPGDRIQLINGVVYLNGKAIPKERVSDYVGPDEYGVVRHVARYRETLPGGKSYYVLDLSPNSSEDNTGVFIVPPGHYFMMGDNRDNSDDSRLEVGYVPAENLVGKAEFRFFSIDESAIWYEPWTWPGAIRFSRMFTLID